MCDKLWWQLQHVIAAYLVAEVKRFPSSSFIKRGSRVCEKAPHHRHEQENSHSSNSKSSQSMFFITLNKPETSFFLCSNSSESAVRGGHFGSLLQNCFRLVADIKNFSTRHINRWRQLFDTFELCGKITEGNSNPFHGWPVGCILPRACFENDLKWPW